VVHVANVVTDYVSQSESPVHAPPTVRGMPMEMTVKMSRGPKRILAHRCQHPPRRIATASDNYDAEDLVHVTFRIIST
jgi:hypothetical protein